MIQFVRIFVLAIILLLFNWWFPIWWSILLLPFLFATFFTRNLVYGFFTSLVAGLIAWGVILSYQYLNGSNLIADRLSDAFHLPGGGIALVVINTILGGLLAALGGVTGSSFHSVFNPKKVSSYYNY